MATLKDIKTFLAMLRGRQIILVINSTRMKVIGANDVQRIDFSPLIAEYVNQNNVYQSSVNTDCALETLDLAFGRLIEEGYCTQSFRNKSDRYAYLESIVTRFYM